MEGKTVEVRNDTCEARRGCVRSLMKSSAQQYSGGYAAIIAAMRLRRGDA